MKPILFSTPMVQAILSGRKTMTRRVVKPDIVNRFDICPVDGPIAYIDQATGDSYPPTAVAPYCVCDILWVRETWGIGIQIAGGIIYKADYTIKAPLADGEKWRPSIFMPRNAARIFLRVTDVRAERLQDISVQDAKDEGIRVHANGCKDGLAFGCYNGDNCVYNKCKRPIEYFHELWDSINFKRGYGWDTNPWVWVISFERCEKQEVQL